MEDTISSTILCAVCVCVCGVCVCVCVCVCVFMVQCMYMYMYSYGVYTYMYTHVCRVSVSGMKHGSVTWLYHTYVPLIVSNPIGRNFVLKVAQETELQKETFSMIHDTASVQYSNPIYFQ